MTRQLTTLTLCLLLASCTTHKAEPARPAFDSSRNPDLLSPDLYPNGVQPEKEPVVRYGATPWSAPSRTLASAT
ncbi:PilL [Pseudomonas aeruginosa]|nr:PilL [Pseudomonas aeruginosa]